MAEDSGELVVTLNFKRFVALSIIAMITIISVGSYVVALLAFNSPSYELRWSASITDIYYSYFNDGKDPFNPGDQVTIESTGIEGDQYWATSSYYAFTDNINVRWIIIVKDPNNMPVHFTSGTLDGVGGSVVIPSVYFNLPSNAVTGSYTARLILWTDWLPSGDSRTLIVDQLSFNVGP